MKLIESKTEYIPQESGIEGIYKIIEVAGRTAYNSQDKITPTSAKDFVDRMIKSKHCYDGNTEILTEKGWIKFSEYAEQKVAVINSDLSFKGFEKPSRVIKKSYTGKFYKFPTLGIEVTDGHRMFGVFRESKNDFYNNSQYSLFECNIPYRDNNGRQKTLGERMFKTPSCCVSPTDEDLKFELLGFWLGDGCYLPQTKNNITFHLKRRHKIEYLKHLCQKLNYTFVEGKGGHYRVVKEGIGEEFCTNFYKNGNKYIPPMYFPSIEAAYSIFKGLINSDGSAYGNGRYSFSNTSLPLIEWVSSVGCLIGYNISEIGISRITTQDKPVYRVYISSTKYSINNDSRRSSSRVIITEKTQTSYCVTVSTGLIMVRGSNKVTTICGNCATLEHGTVYLKLPFSNLSVGATNTPREKAQKLLNKYIDNKYTQVFVPDLYGDWLYATSNMRVLVENNWLDDLKYLCPPTESHEKRYTMRFTCSRAIANELVRHRTMSFLQESTRYINYSKERHGGEITFIKPSWLNVPTGIVYWHDGICWRVQQDENNPMEWFSVIPQNGFSKEEAQVASTYFDALNHTEKKYFFLLRENCQPQQARDVLPNATKTELVMTGFSSDWKRLLRLRLFEETGKVHPDMKVLMEKLKAECIKNEIWDDIINSDCKEI
jgi:thymidylate synthase (FAD)